MLSVATVLVVGVWLVDYSGDATRAATSVRAAGIEAAHYAADALAAPLPPQLDEATAHQDVLNVADGVVRAAAISDCDTTDARFSIATKVHRLPANSKPAAVSVEVICPLAVSPLFADTVRARVAVPVADHAARHSERHSEGQQ